jgi:hypothetical protein
MTLDRIVEPIDVTAEGILGFGSGLVWSRLEGGAPDQLGFQGLEDRLDDRVVITVSCPNMEIAMPCFHSAPWYSIEYHWLPLSE